MSSSAQAGPSVPKDKEKKGFSKFLTRAKTILKKSDGSKRLSMLGSSSTPAPAATTATPAKKEAPAPKSKEEARAKYENLEGVKKVDRKELFEERARRLGEKYGLEIKQGEWYSTEGTALRVEKSIRMRVHRTCAACSATFSSAKECPSCGSTKYKRYPPKRTEAEKVASREKRAAMMKAHKENAPIIPDWRVNPKEPILKKPPKCGTQDLVHKKPRQRVRRICHECESLFYSGTKTCAKCGHVRCTDCPRDPPKREKYPFGYPGDEFGPKAIPHHECHECKTIFPGGAPDGTVCKKCQHQKCTDCQRLKPRKVEPELDPELVKSVQARLDALRLG